MGVKKNPSNKQKEDYVVGNVWQHDLKRLAYDVLQEMFNNLWLIKNVDAMVSLGSAGSLQHYSVRLNFISTFVILPVFFKQQFHESCSWP